MDAFAAAARVASPRDEAGSKRLETMRRKIRGRYPTLKDGALNFVDGRTREGAFLPGLIAHALRSAQGLKEERKPVTFAEPKADLREPEYLRRVIEAADATVFAAGAGATYAALVEVTPRKVHACWHLPAGALAGARAGLGDGGREARPALRFYDVTGVPADQMRWNSTFDIEIAPAETGKYIDLWSADRGYFAELGLLCPDGRFLALARTGRVHVPREKPGNAAGNLWLPMEANRLPAPRPETPELFRLPESRIIVAAGENDWPLRDLEAERGVRAVYREFLRDGPRVLRRAEPIRRRDPATLTEEYARREERRNSQEHAARKLAAREKRQSRAEVFFARLDRARAPRTAPRSAGTVEHYLAPLGERKAAPIYPDFAPALFVSRTTAVETQRLALPAPKPERKTKTVRISKLSETLKSLKESGLELEAELILRGKVQPGKKVRIGGAIIQTAPDGSFCVSCVVRDGKLHVPVEVVEAEMVVAREEVSVSLGK